MRTDARVLGTVVSTVRTEVCTAIGCNGVALVRLGWLCHGGDGGRVLLVWVAAVGRVVGWPGGVAGLAWH